MKYFIEVNGERFAMISGILEMQMLHADSLVMKMLQELFKVMRFRMEVVEFGWTTSDVMELKQALRFVVIEDLEMKIAITVKTLESFV